MQGVHWEMPGVGAEVHRLAIPPEKPVDPEVDRLHHPDYDVVVRGQISGGQAVHRRGIISPQELTREMRAPALRVLGARI